MPNPLVPLGMDNVNGLQHIAGPNDVLSIPHIAGMTAAPAIATGAGTGTGSPTASIAAGGTDLAGLITVNTGTVLTPTTSGTVVTVTFANPGSAAPNIVMIIPANSAAALLSGSGTCFVNSADTLSTAFIIKSGVTALVGAVTYKYYYLVIW